MSVALRWTGRGAVAAPGALQLRVARAASGRLRAGAPEPSRDLTGAEALDNVRWFAAAGPRGRPVTVVILSGLAAADFDPAEVSARIRGEGIARLVWHLEPSELRALGDARLADEWVVVWRDEPVPDAFAAATHAVIPLDAEGLPRIAERARAARAAGVGRLTLTWPFPGPGVSPPPPAGEVVEALRAAAPILDAGRWAVRGLPACAFEPGRWPGEGPTRSRAANRWYVDADHQRERALLFQPDVLRFAKRDSCRFCDLDATCDGVPAAWLALGLGGALLPLRAGSG